MGQDAQGDAETRLCHAAKYAATRAAISAATASLLMAGQLSVEDPVRK
jgi:hypothetical protein